VAEAPGRHPRSQREPLLRRPFYWFCWSLCLLVATVVFRYRRLGLRHIPKRGAVLIVANHQSYLDPVLVGLAVQDRMVTPLARSGLFKNRLLGALLRALGVVPIAEDGGDVAAIKQGVAQLRAGRIVAIYPEGARSPDGKMRPFKRGALLLIKRSTAPILPIAVSGAHEAWPRSRRFPRVIGARVAVNIGQPIGHDELLKDGDDEALRRLERVITELKAEIDPIVVQDTPTA